MRDEGGWDELLRLADMIGRARARADDIDPLIPLSEVLVLSGLSKTKIYGLIKAGAFPAPYKPGGAASRWSRREVLAWRESLRQRRG